MEHVQDLRDIFVDKTLGVTDELDEEHLLDGYAKFISKDTIEVNDEQIRAKSFVIATGTSRRQLHAMSEEIDHALEDGMGDRRLGIEGYDESRWILLDYGDVVIHLFDAETRAYYGLEGLWGQAKRVPFEPRPAGPSVDSHRDQFATE